ncbi:MAG: hypothetical protein JNK85_23725 [Verrucomicrobiales bacterium]|nr:hypothetical protein [Verrucomicrobiales bacterium]
MSENEPSTSPVPPKPGEAAKVQPKKETVRIALPPKPTAAPTVRLPAPAPAAAAPSTAAAAPVAVGAPKPAPAAAPAAAAPKAPTGAPASAPAPMSRPTMAPASFGGGISGLDKGLAIAAAVVGLAFLLHVVLIALGIQVE